MLVPRQDLEFASMERIKGFSIDLLLLVQKQRTSLAETINHLKTIKNSVEDLENPERSSDTVN